MSFKNMSIQWKGLFIVFFMTYGIISYWMFYPYKPFVIEGDIKILNPDKKVAPGGRLTYEMKVDKRMPLPAVIHKQLINHYIVTYSSITGNVPVGKRTMRVSILIPQYASSGKYKLRWEGVYHVNPIRDISVIGLSEEFTVTGKCIPVKEKR